MPYGKPPSVLFWRNTCHVEIHHLFLFWCNLFINVIQNVNWVDQKENWNHISKKDFRVKLFAWQIVSSLDISFYMSFLFLFCVKSCLLVKITLSIGTEVTWWENLIADWMLTDSSDRLRPSHFHSTILEDHLSIAFSRTCCYLGAVEQILTGILPLWHLDTMTTTVDMPLSMGENFGGSWH